MSYRWSVYVSFSPERVAQKAMLFSFSGILNP